MMCTGAIIQSRVRRVVYGCDNHDFGYLSRLENKKIVVTPHVMEAECREVMHRFFQDKRK